MCYCSWFTEVTPTIIYDIKSISVIQVIWNTHLSWRCMKDEQKVYIKYNAFNCKMLGNIYSSKQGMLHRVKWKMPIHQSHIKNNVYKYYSQDVHRMLIAKHAKACHVNTPCSKVLEYELFTPGRYMHATSSRRLLTLIMWLQCGRQNLWQVCETIFNSLRLIDYW